MSIGKLYRSSDNQFLTHVKYQLLYSNPNSWAGELIPVNGSDITDGSGYLIELTDKMKRPCTLKSGRTVRGRSPYKVYRFGGSNLS